LSRYYPPGIIIEYEKDGTFQSQHKDLLDLDERYFIITRTDIGILANQIIEETMIPKTKRDKLIDCLKRLQSKTLLKGTYQLQKTIKTHMMPLTNCTFDKSGSRFATGSYDRIAKIWDTKTGKEIHSLQGHQNVVYCLAFNNPFRFILLTSDKIATGSFDKTAKLWDAELGTCLQTYHGHGAEIVSIGFNPSSTMIGTGSMDYSAMLWDTRTGDEIKRLRGHSGEVIATQFSPNGYYLLTASFDSTIQIWDMRSQKSMYTLIGHRGEVSNAIFNYSGDKVVSGSLDSTARVWDVNTGSCLFTST
jgi:dynein assembly factor with WDR repeat domains 1